ncbi:myomesin-1 isoform X1 [Myotis myotis]|uniref:Myomesin-1 n=1 Tax=Myotis myotis TaxID=51298 RepID=A0A7J7VZM6_MYOMY|nr:myomesin-1 isoform X1 [Myotis myotis]KAF6330523.1 myomesin 1 [Myotis myotis]
MSLPFYQKLHEHYDRSYRNKDLRTTMSQYHEQEKKSSAIYTHGSTAYSSRSLAARRQESQAFSQASSSSASYLQQASQATTESSLASAVSRKAASAYDYGYSHGLTDSNLMLEDYSSKLSPQMKRAKKSLLSGEEKENLPSDYMVPIFSGRQVHVSGITDTEEERIKEAAAYIAQRNLLASEEGITTSKQSTVSKQSLSTLHQEEVFEKKSRKVAIREKAERLSLRKTLEETEAFHRKMNEDHLLHAPEFVIKPRSHTVWEKENVKLHCSVSGWPAPRVTWYKNQVPINVHANPGKYIIESRYGMHTLEINKCDFEDTAQYRASAMNAKGELSAYASVVVKRYKGEFDETRFHAGASTLPLSFAVTPYGYASKFDIHFDDKFDVSFGREGETLSLGCRVVITPEIKHFQPEIQWYRNGIPVSSSKWVQPHWSGDRATLTFSHLNKEDEGLYTIRVRMGEYYEQYSAYVFVRDGDAEIEGAPASPLDVVCVDANKDYIIVTWKQPAVDGGSPILGYFIDKCEVGTDSWSQCNDTPVKFARFPVTGLLEGRSYIFRVRAVNKSGIGLPSRVSEPAAALDPAEKARLRSHPSAPWTGQIIVTEEEPREGIVPGPPTDLSVTEATQSYVVLSWKPPGQRGHEGILYFVEKCDMETENWQRVNTELPVKSPRFALFDLTEGKSYRFRVRCSNSAGVGEPSEATEVTVVGDKLDIPKAPGNIIPSRNTDTSVVVSWEESKDAKELVGYYIESSVVGSGKWEPCNNNPVKGPRFTCHGLATGQSYIFRVRAVNAAGLSEYSQDSEAIEVKAAIGGGVSPDVWPELNDAPGGLTDSRGGMQGTSQPAFKKDALLDSKLSKPSLPSSSHNLGQKEVSKVSETVQEELTPPPQKAALKGESKSDDPKKKKNLAAPSPPYDITCLESFRDSMVLGWKQPDKSGGAEITGYYVNYREVIDGVPGKWREANIKAVSEEAYKISNLKENTVYQFQVAAMNIAGLGVPSAVSECFKCEEWTIAVPGPPQNLKYSEVRKTSLVLQWKPPIHSGRTPVTGYFVDMKEANAKDDQWRGLNKAALTNKYLKVQGLQEGVSYVFRVRAINQAGVGKPSDLAGPVVAETRPGTKELVVSVNDDGIISLNFECDQMAPNSEFTWSKDYVATEDSARLEVESKGNKTKITFKELGMEDLGIYSCDVTETDGIAASYLIDEEELKRLLALSQEHKFPTVAVKSDLAVEILEKGQVRFWMQAEKLSGNAKVNYVFNEKEIFEGPKYKMHIDRNTGIIEMFMDKLLDEDEGTYTFQLQDGRATGHSTLVLIGDVYKNLQKEAEFQRQEWIRKQGPHFAEYLSWEVTGECNVLLKCKVANIKKETHILWYKDEREISVDEKHDFKDGICTLLITEFSKKDAGIYEVILKDDRGKDKSRLKLVDKAFQELMTEVCKKIALSASDLKIQSTAEGIRLYSLVTYYLDDLKVNWSHNGTAIRYTDRVKSGVTGEQQIWLQISEPTPNDQGKYVMELFDGKTGHQKTVDLSGQDYEEAFAEFQRLKQAAIAEKNRARVVGGLPDVVTIQEGKTLNLTCTVWGDPTPEISWLKNEKSLDSDDHCNLRFEAGKTAFFTVTGVTTADSGKYGLVVKNKYGSETIDFTISVFIPEEEARMAAAKPQKGAKSK